MSTTVPRNRVDLHLRLAVFRRDGYTCQHCGRAKPFHGLELDHVLPLSWGGNEEFDNLQALCIRCNRQKGARFDG